MDRFTSTITLSWQTERGKGNVLTTSATPKLMAHKHAGAPSFLFSFFFGMVHEKAVPSYANVVMVISGLVFLTSRLQTYPGHCRGLLASPGGCRYCRGLLAHGPESSRNQETGSRGVSTLVMLSVTEQWVFASENLTPSG